MNFRFLANENFPTEVVEWLRKRGDDVIHASEEMVGAPDEALYLRASQEERILLTLDRDFGEFVFHRRTTNIGGIVLIRFGQISAKLMISMLISFFLSDAELTGFFTVVSPGHYRQTPIDR